MARYNLCMVKNGRAYAKEEAKRHARELERMTLPQSLALTFQLAECAELFPLPKRRRDQLHSLAWWLRPHRLGTMGSADFR